MNALNNYLQDKEKMLLFANGLRHWIERHNDGKSWRWKPLIFHHPNMLPASLKCTK